MVLIPPTTIIANTGALVIDTYILGVSEPEVLLTVSQLQSCASAAPVQLCFLDFQRRL